MELGILIDALNNIAEHIVAFIIVVVAVAVAASIIFRIMR